MKAWSGTRLSRVLQGRGWDLTANLAPNGSWDGKTLERRPTSQLDKSLPAAAQGLPAAAHGLAAAAHPQQLHKGVVVAAHEGPFHKSLLAATAAVALTLFAGLPAAARGPLVPAHP